MPFRLLSSAEPEDVESLARRGSERAFQANIEMLSTIGRMFWFEARCLARTLAGTADPNRLEPILPKIKTVSDYGVS